MFVKEHNSRLLLFFSVLLSLRGAEYRHLAEADSSFIYAACSPAKHDPITPFQTNLDSLLASIVAGASLVPFGNYSSGDRVPLPPGIAVFGLFQCRTDVAPGDCAACVRSAVAQLSLVCPQSFAVALQLEGCLVRYSNEDFSGRPDTATVFYKCAAGGANEDVAFLRRREDVLADLPEGPGIGYQVRASDTVQGDAQCQGDLSEDNCSACLERAVAQLRSECTEALAGEVYLARCYARYWAPGNYFESSAVIADESNDGRKTGSTVAIVVGVFAGFFLFAAMLSLLKTHAKLSGALCGRDSYYLDSSSLNSGLDFEMLGQMPLG